MPLLLIYIKHFHDFLCNNFFFLRVLNLFMRPLSAQFISLNGLLLYAFEISSLEVICCSATVFDEKCPNFWSVFKNKEERIAFKKKSFQNMF